MNKTLFSIVLLVAATSAIANPDIDDKVAAALAATSRPAADVDRDDNRLPLETLKFFGLEDDMRVLELLPGGGWYTRVLAPVLKDDGKLYVALGAGRTASTVLTEAGFEDVQVLTTEDNLRRDENTGTYVVDDFSFGVDELDMVLTFRNLHNFDAPSRKKINRAVMNSLKSGGYYGVIDHTRRHMEPDSPENGRRVDPVLVIKEMLDIGFEFVDYSDLHYRADDELEYEVGRRSVSGNTDRFTMLFRKP